MGYSIVLSTLLRAKIPVDTLCYTCSRKLICRAWQAYHDRTKEAVERWREVAHHISLESFLEGVPLIFLAIVYINSLSSACVFATCDPAAIAREFPSHVLTLPPRPALSADDVHAIHLDGPSCGELPLTSDGWFTMDLSRLNTDFLDRPAAALERVIELEIPGESIL